MREALAPSSATAPDTTVLDALAVAFAENGVGDRPTTRNSFRSFAEIAEIAALEAEELAHESGESNLIGCFVSASSISDIIYDTTDVSDHRFPRRLFQELLFAAAEVYGGDAWEDLVLACG